MILPNNIIENIENFDKDNYEFTIVKNMEEGTTQIKIYGSKEKVCYMIKRLGQIICFIGISIIGIYVIYVNNLNVKNDDIIENYIENTSVITKKQDEPQEEVIEEVKNKKANKINYTAVLEIPNINLKRGVVDSTAKFKSINYAISVDKSSNYPNEYGNFILYVHSGNSSVAYFRNLNKVNINDDVYVYYNGRKYHYVINDKYDISKTGKAVLKKPINDNYITLITCNQSKKGYQTILTDKLIDYITY